MQRKLKLKTVDCNLLITSSTKPKPPKATDVSSYKFELSNLVPPCSYQLVGTSFLFVCLVEMRVSTSKLVTGKWQNWSGCFQVQPSALARTCCMFSQFVPLCLSCRFLVCGVNQRSWEHLANLPGAFKSWLSQSLSPHISPNYH